MWACTPRLSTQPELTKNDSGIFSPPGASAIHCVLGPIFRNDVQIWLCDRYSLKLWWQYNTEENGDAVLLGPQDGKNFYYPSAALCDNGAPIRTVKLPNLGTVRFARFRSSFGTFFNKTLGEYEIHWQGSVAVSTGFAWDTSVPNPQLVMYAHLVGIGFLAQDALGQAWNTFGARTCGLRANVDASAALIGPARMQITNTGPMETAKVAAIGARLGQFESVQLALPQTSSARASNAQVPQSGDRVAYSFSRAQRFLAPSAGVGLGSTTIAVSGNNAAGHREYNMEFLPAFDEPHQSYPDRFPVWLAGQPDSSVAWIPQSSEWQANCAFTAEQNERMSVLHAQVTDLRGGKTLDGISFAINELRCTDYGNSEYAGFCNQTFQNTFPELRYARLFVQVRSTIDDSFYVQVDAFTTGFPEPGSATDRQVFRDVAFKSLTESEAIAFFNGGSITLDFLRGGTVVLTAVGP